MTELQKAFIANLKKQRSRAGLTQEALAEKIGIAHHYYGALELGYKFPSVQTMEKIAEALGIEPYRLFIRTESTTSVSPEEMLDRYTETLLEQMSETVRRTQKKFRQQIKK